MRNISLFSENQYQTMMRKQKSENQKKREVRTSKSENHKIAEVRTTLSENQGPTKNSAEELECVEYVDFNGKPQRRYYEKKSK
tara:strand:+ start:812 stop:1060 length:249 start_codon:yes stop_codon:yes gene_type:complete